MSKTAEYSRSKCNTGLGLFQDSSTHLIAAIEYLRKEANAEEAEVPSSQGF